MADTPDDPNWTSPLVSGARSPQQEAPPPDRSFPGWIRDTGIDVGRGVLGIARDVTGAKAAISTAAPDRVDPVRQRENLTALEDLDWFMKRGKTETGRYREERPPTWGEAPVGKATETLAGVAAYAPLAMTGPLAAPVFGGLAGGHATSDLHQRIREASEEELMKIPDYAEARRQGKTDQAARDDLFVAGSDPRKLDYWKTIAPAVIGNVIGGGIGGIVLNKATQRTINEAITDRVLQNINNAGTKAFLQRRAFGVGEAAIGGAAGMAGTEWTRQGTEADVGLRQGVDYGDVAAAGLEGAATFGPIGLVGMRQNQAARRDLPHGPPRPTAQQRAPARADDLGVDTMAAAAAENAHPDLGPATEPRAMGPFQQPRPGIPEDIQQSEYGPVSYPRPGQRRPLPAERGPWDADRLHPLGFPEDIEQRPVQDLGEIPPRPGGEPPEPPGPPAPPRPLPDEGGGIAERPLPPQFPEIERPGAPRPGEFGGEPAESEIPYADRAKLRAGIRTLDPQERGQIADTLERAVARGVVPRINIPGAEWLDRFVETSPRALVAELRRGIEGVRQEAALTQEHINALGEVMRRGGEQAAQWATEIQRALDSGVRTLTWNRLPKSMRDALGADRAAVVDAVRRDPRAVVDVLARQERAPEAPRYREAAGVGEPQPQEEVPNAPVTRPPTGQAQVRPEVQGRRQVAPEVFREVSDQAQRQALASEFGEERPVSTERPFLRRGLDAGRPRVGTDADIGITRTGRFAPGTEVAMARAQGTTLRHAGPRTETFAAAVRRRAAERRSERTAYTSNIRVPERAVHENRPEVPEPRPDWRQQPEAPARDTAQQAHRERVAEETARRHKLQEDVAEAAHLERGRRATGETVDTMARFREAVSQEFQRALARIPFVREMARHEAREQARLDRDAQRKRRTRRGDLDYRERVVRNILRDEHTEFIERIEELITPEPISPTGQRYEGTERLAMGEADVRRGAEIARLDQIPRETLLQAARRVAEAMKARVELAREALETAMLERTPAGQKPRIGWSVPTVRSGMHSWYDRLADLNRYAIALEREVGTPNRGDPRRPRAEGEGEPSEREATVTYAASEGRAPNQTRREPNVEVVRGMLTNIWLREKLMKEGRIAEWEEYHREHQQMTYEEVRARRQALQNELDRRSQPGSEDFSARRESAIRSELNELRGIMDALEEIGSKDPVDLEMQLIGREDMLGKMLRENERRIVLDWTRERLTGMDEAQRIEAQRAIERQRQANAEQAARRENPEAFTPSRVERQQRLRQLEERADQIMQALDGVPTDRKGRIREIIDTLRYRTARPGEQPERLTRPQMTEQRLNEMIGALHREMTEIETESRRLAEGLNPGIVQNEYGLRGVLDPAADMTKRANLPTGSYARRVNDFLSGRDSIRPQMPGTVIDERGQKVFRPGDKSAAIINHYLNVIGEVTGDAHVIALTEEQMQLAARQRGLPADTPAFYDVRTHRILIDRNVLNSENRTRVLTHELGHPMIEAAVQRFPEIARRLDNIRKIVRQEWLNNNPEVHEALGYQTQGLDNVHEFLTELYSDGGKMASALQAIHTSDVERAQFETARAENLLDRTLRSIKRGLTNLFFSLSKKRLLNDATINSLELFESVRRLGRVRARPDDIARPITPEAAREWVAKRGQDTGDRFTEFKSYLGGGDLSMALHNLSDMEHRGSQGLRPKVSEVSRVMDRTNATARRYEQDAGTEELAHRIADLERVNKRAHDELQDYIYDENHLQLSGADPLHEGRNSHVSKDAPANLQQREAYPELRRRWEALTDVQKGLRNDMLAHYEKRHGEMLNAQVGQLVDVKKLIPDGSPGGIRSRLIRYIIDGAKSLDERETRALERYVPGFKAEDSGEHRYFQQQIAQLRAVPQFKKLPIWYPSMRRGQWVVEARYNLDRHAKGGTQRMRDDGSPSGEFEFKTAAERDAFIKAVNADEAFRGVRLIETPDVVYAKDEKGGILMRDGEPVPLTEYVERTRTRGDELEPGYRQEVTEGVARRVRAGKEGEDGIVRYRAHYNPLLLEFHERQMEAQRRHMELRREAEQGHMRLEHVEPVRDHRNTYVDPQKMDRMYRELQDSVTNSRGWREMDETTRALVLRDLKEGAIRSMLSQSARSTYLPRRYAMGERKDMLRNFIEYNKNTAHTLAGLEHRAELHEALKAMDDYVKGKQYWGSPEDPQGKFGVTDERVRRSMHARAMRHPNEITEPFWSKGLTQVLRLSYLDKLMSPMFTTLQIIEPWIVSAPALAGKYGVSTYPELYRAMRDLQGMSTMGAGMRDAWRTAKAGPFARLTQSDLVGRLKDNVRGDEEAVGLLDHMERHSQLDRNAGLELGRMYDESISTSGRTLDWLDHMSRQVNSQVEGVNRAAVGLAAYRLARGKGESIEAAKEYARQMVHETAGNYNAYASAPIFNNPYLRPALQFKRYAQRMSSHWMRAIYSTGLALAGKLPPEQRAEAFRQMAFMAGTAIFTSGFLGLPTEPIKAVINASSLATGFNSDDAERMAYEASLKAFGPDLGEFLAKGGFRLAGIGAGQRTGYDSLWTFGALGKRPSDWYQAAGHFVAGAPGSYAVDAVQGSASLVNSMGHLINDRETEASHEFWNGMEKLFPVKTIADTIGAVRKQVGGTTFRTQSGLPQGYQPELWETAMQAFGVQSARQQQFAEKRSAMKSDLRRYNEQRRSAQDIYAHADDRERAALGPKLVREFNTNWPEMQPLTIGDLMKARQRLLARETADPSMLGVTMTRRQQALLPRYGMYRNE